MTRKIVTVNDSMQKKYTYELTEPMGKNFNPLFNPDLTPKQMLALGIFGGIYMRDCTNEFPKDWFVKAKFQKNGIFKKDPTLNFFGVNASQSLLIWQQKGWIHPDDPRGWFQWYCRYYMGRRHPDDMRQIRRWRAISRHIAQLTKNCSKGNWSCRPVQRQAILHWAYDSRTL